MLEWRLLSQSKAAFLTEGDRTDFLSTSTPCWPCRQAVSFLCVLWETCLTSSRRFSTWQREKRRRVRRRATARGFRSQTVTEGTMNQIRHEADLLTHPQIEVAIPSLLFLLTFWCNTIVLLVMNRWKMCF